MDIAKLQPEMYKHFGEADLAALVMVITVINAWDRICATTRMTPANA